MTGREHSFPVCQNWNRTMNIRDYWPLTAPSVSDVALWQRMIAMRRETFMGFLTIEQTNGFVKAKVSLATSHGQEMVRIISFRVLEELAEAIQSENDDHYYEELIDAFNYLLSLFLLGEIQHPALAQQLTELCYDVWSRSNHYTIERLTEAHIGKAAIILGARLGDLLRNRAWMQNAQNTYFDANLFQVLYWLFFLILNRFKSFEQFYCYYIAKDSVLQFRLRSQY